MNIVDYGFELEKMDCLNDELALYIDLIADMETKKVYLNNYFEGLYIDIGEARFNIYTEIVDGKIIGKMLYETVEGLSLMREEKRFKFLIKNRIGNTYIENIVNIGIDEKVINFGHKKQFFFVPKSKQYFNFVNCNVRINLNNPFEIDKREIYISRIDTDSEGLIIYANMSKKLTDIIDKEGETKELCLAWKEIKTKKKYYFHKEKVFDGIIKYKLLKTEMNLLNKIDSNSMLFEWILIDSNENEYRLYINNEKMDFKGTVLPVTDYYAEVFKCQDDYLQMNMITSLLFEYVGLYNEGNGLIINFKKRSYSLNITSIIIQRVNTDIEYRLPYEILAEDDEYITYGITFLLDVLENDFRIGIHQFWVEFQDGDFEERVPLKLLRREFIKENVYLTAVHPYAVINDYYFNCLFYNDSSNNLKCNIEPKRLKLQIEAVTEEEDRIALSILINREPFFDYISGFFIRAENDEIIDLQYIQEYIVDKDQIKLLGSVPIDVMINEKVNKVFVPEIRFNNKKFSVKIENNYYRPAVNGRENNSFQVLRTINNGMIKKIWGDHYQGSYVLGSTENCGLFSMKGMWLYENDKLCIGIEWSEKNYENKYDDKYISLYLKNRITEEIISFDRELAVENEIIFRVPLDKITYGDFLVYGQIQDGIISYIEFLSASYTLISEVSSKKILLKKEDSCLYISVEELLLFENSSQVIKCQEIIQKAQTEKTEKSRKIWLVGENYGLSARDNGLAFFEYCMSRKDGMDTEVYFITKAENKDIGALDIYKDNVLIYDSPEHIYLDELAEFYIVSHGIRDVMPSLYHNSIGKYRKNVIYLQHGVIAMKKCGMSNKSYGGSIRKFVVSSEQECNLLVDNRQFWEDEIIVTGLSRFDKLLASVDKSENYIWIMPTWRDWLVKLERDFTNSDFYKYYSTILQDKKLEKQLRESKQKLIFSLHIEFEKYKCFFDIFENDVVHITDMHEKSIAERIKECQMIITDYSSIVFDAIYLGKPVLFFQFDQDLYNKYRGSYVDLESTLPGEVLHSPERLVDSLISMIQNNFQVESKYIDRAKKFFDYHDCNNSERIYDEILKCREEIADEY